MNNKISKLVLIKNKFLDLIGVNYCSKKFDHIYYPHKICIVINQECSIGNNCTIYQGVTIGKKDKETKEDAPKIGNNCTIYANSTIIGNIEIGDNTIIGANSLVISNIPKNSIACGNPAKVIKKRCYNE